jgi:hypothetical protein
MPLRSQRLDNRIRHRLLAFLALGTIPVRMTVDTPRIPIFFDKRRAGVKWITTLRTEEVPGMPFCTARYDDFTLDGRLARLATWREHLMKVEMAEETLGFIRAIFAFETGHVVRSGVTRKELDVFTALTSANARDAFDKLVVGLRVEGYAFEMLTALVAGKAFRVKAESGCRYNPTSDG